MCSRCQPRVNDMKVTVLLETCSGEKQQKFLELPIISLLETTHPFGKNAKTHIYLVVMTRLSIVFAYFILGIILFSSSLKLSKSRLSPQSESTVFSVSLLLILFADEEGRTPKIWASFSLFLYV